ncbi:DUF6191 domain-containing protein [Streptomyces uncialis]|uniref:Regulatory protein n=1 Tax=Streptomyces uncialis TaxID=1048205 RepID=A0A1Q4V142_9ACTN|nr:DUF6191 domain-containing protein [Streptomyces uncialis]MCX4659931.1 DUF6191 domain-containing protein [Streptomyces uncialis]OKH91558.1 hypothetical protein AB852_28830 [Streptomyces uncialis]
MFNPIQELFAPGRKHTEDERQRLELTRVDLNDGDPGQGPIDLTSGKVTIRVPPQPASADLPGQATSEDRERDARNGNGRDGADGGGARSDERDPDSASAG